VQTTVYRCPTPSLTELVAPGQPTVLTDRTEEVAQSAVYLRQMELHHVETNNTESRPSPSPKAEEEEDHIIDQLNTTDKLDNNNDNTTIANDMTNNQKYEHQPTLNASHLHKGTEWTTKVLMTDHGYQSKHSRLSGVVHRFSQQRH
jgi:hypothetical protein